MTVGELLGGGFGVLKRRPKELAIWTVIQLAVGVAMVATLMPLMASIATAQQRAVVDGTPAAPAIPAGIGLALLAYVLILVWLLMLFTAVVRATAHTGEDKLGWLRFGGDELRLIGLGILYFVGSIVLWLLVTLLVGAVVAAIAFGSPGVAGILGVVVGLVCVCAAIWLSVRLSLVGAVFVLERSFALRKGWQATKGRFWTLFLTYLVMTVAYVILEVIVVTIMYPGYLGSLAGNTADPAQALERQQQALASIMSPSVGTIAMWIVGTILGTAALVYYVGVIATAAIAGTGYSRQDLAELESHFE